MCSEVDDNVENAPRILLPPSLANKPTQPVMWSSEGTKCRQMVNNFAKLLNNFWIVNETREQIQLNKVSAKSRAAQKIGKIQRNIFILHSSHLTVHSYLSTYNITTLKPSLNLNSVKEILFEGIEKREKSIQGNFFNGKLKARKK